MAKTVTRCRGANGRFIKADTRKAVGGICREKSRYKGIFKKPVKIRIKK
jgi:hypothetical protein